MNTSSAPTFQALASKYSSGSSDSNFDECFQILWHYDCVLSPQSTQTPLTSPAPNDLSAEEQNSSLRECFPLSLSMHRLQPLFQMLDENNDGKVSVDEMMCVLGKLGKELSQSYLLSLMDPLAVDFTEFTALYQAICDIEFDKNMQEEGTQQTEPEFDYEEFLDTFNVYDKNRDGYICASELAEVLRDFGFPEGMDLEKCQTLIDRVDTDGNGLVDLREFKEMLAPSTRNCAIASKAKTSEPFVT